MKTKGTYQVIQATFSDFPHWLAADDRGSVKGLMADLGVSSRQFDRGERGFSYLHDGPLDMRMNMESGQSAAELLAGISQTGLAALLRLYGEERYAASIAAAIVARRRKEPITRTLELAEIVASAVPARERREGNPARKTFQAIRMAVNQEQEELAHLLDVIPPVMAQGGRLTRHLDGEALKEVLSSLYQSDRVNLFETVQGLARRFKRKGGRKDEPAS